MSVLDMESGAPPLDPPHIPVNVVTMILQCMSLSDRFTCALVCKAWAGAATAATRSIILSHGMQDLSCFQIWLEKHGHQLEVLQLNLQENDEAGALTALPCPQLHDLLVSGHVSLDGRVWSDIAAATKLTSVTLQLEQTASQQSDIISALTALPDVKQLVLCHRWAVGGPQQYLTDSMLLQKLTKLTVLRLGAIAPGAGSPAATAAALEHLGLLAGLQDLSISAAGDWAVAGCPGLQELKELTRLQLVQGFLNIPASVSQLTALRQLHVCWATPAALIRLHVLTGLTQLWVQVLRDLLPVETPPLQLPGLQHLQVLGATGTMPMSFLASCTQLQVLSLRYVDLRPDGLVASTMLQHLELAHCMLRAGAEAEYPVSWQQVFPGQLPNLTSLKMMYPWPNLQHADMECVAYCCSSLLAMHLDTLQDSFPSALMHLSGLTSLTLWQASDQQRSSLAQLTGLRELKVGGASEVLAAGCSGLLPWGS